MNQLINNKVINFCFVVFVSIIIAKIISLIVFYSLPKQSIDLQVLNLEDKKLQLLSSPFKNLQTNPQETKATNNIATPINNLKLIAIYKESSSGGFVVISDGSQTDVLKLGDSYKNYKLIEINSDNVYLSQNNQKYKLEFLKENFVNSFEQNEQEIVKSNSHSIPSAPHLSNINAPQSLSYKLQKDDISSSLKDLESAKKNIVFKEILKDGEIEGFRVLNLNRNSFFGNLGIVPGDIVKTVNGVEVKNYSKILELYNSIDSYDNIKVEIIRNNIIREINYEIF